jgi:hypothetical protein
MEENQERSQRWKVRLMLTVCDRYKTGTAFTRS